MHDLFVIPPEFGGSGLGKRAFQEFLKVYQDIGINNINVHANIDVGGYAWARYGFVPDKEDWNDIRKAKAKFNRWAESRDIPKEAKEDMAEIFAKKDPTAMWEIADYEHKGKKIGKDFLLGKDWVGDIDVTNDGQMQRFFNYISSKKEKGVEHG